MAPSSCGFTPPLIKHSHLLSKVGGSNNAVVVDGDLVGSVLLYGQGAGGRPTASAVIGDLIDLVHSMRKGVNNRIPMWFDRNYEVRPFEDVVSGAYFRMHVEDRPGVLADITRVLAEHDISIDSIVQKSADAETDTAELVVLTHPAQAARPAGGAPRLRRPRLRTPGLRLPARRVSGSHRLNVMAPLQ